MLAVRRTRAGHETTRSSLSQSQPTSRFRRRARNWQSLYAKVRLRQQIRAVVILRAAIGPYAVAQVSSSNPHFSGTDSPRMNSVVVVAVDSI